MSGSSWMARAGARIETWPVAGMAAWMLAGATAFFCWSIPDMTVWLWLKGLGLPAGADARTAFIIIPALATGASTWAIFRGLDARAARRARIEDEGDDQEDWLTPPARRVKEPLIVKPEPVVVRPLILDAIADFPVDTAAPVEGPAAFPPTPCFPPPESDELLLDEMIDDEPEPARSGMNVPIAELMEKLAAEMGTLAPPALRPRDAEGHRPLPRHGNAPPAAAAVPDEDALRAAILDLQRLAARRG
ncbi:hypothetical protein [Edaphosphingomonas haloaromaticamans]|nr:hypothetical protein [Sphingomonas haloaromaticamans]